MDKEDRYGNSNIQVAIRVRPMLEKETTRGEHEIVRVEDNLVVRSKDCVRSD